MACDFSGFPVTPGESHSVRVLCPCNEMVTREVPMDGEHELGPRTHRLMVAPDGVAIPKVNLRAPVPTGWGRHYQEQGPSLGLPS